MQQEIINKIIDILKEIYKINIIEIVDNNILFKYKNIDNKISIIILENKNILLRFKNEYKYRSLNISNKNDLNVYIQVFIKECLQ